MNGNQTEMVLRYIDKFGSITPLEALGDLGIMRLAARISDLRKMGFPVAKRTVSRVNRFGKSVSFAEYYMEDTEVSEE